MRASEHKHDSSSRVIQSTTAGHLWPTAGKTRPFVNDRSGHRPLGGFSVGMRCVCAEGTGAPSRSSVVYVSEDPPRRPRPACTSVSPSLSPLRSRRSGSTASSRSSHDMLLVVFSSSRSLPLSGSVSCAPSPWILLYLKPSNLFTVGLPLLYVSNLTAASFNSPVWRLHDKADMGF